MHQLEAYIIEWTLVEHPTVTEVQSKAHENIDFFAIPETIKYNWTFRAKVLRSDFSREFLCRETAQRTKSTHQNVQGCSNEFV